MKIIILVSIIFLSNFNVMAKKVNCSLTRVDYYANLELPSKTTQEFKRRQCHIMSLPSLSGISYDPYNYRICRRGKKFKIQVFKGVYFRKFLIFEKKILLTSKFSRKELQIQRNIFNSTSLICN